MSTELVPRSSTVPANEWINMTRQAEYLAQSDIVPAAYRRKPANVVVAALTGRIHGWDVLTAMRNGHVIEGVWGMKPEAQLGLVRAAGHQVDIELNEEGPIEQRGALVTAHRGDEKPFISKFTIGMAAEKGLVAIKDGKPWARSSQGKRLPWEQYPVDMCMWRAVGRACRAKYSDITLGIYSVEELGASIDAEGEVIDVGEIDHRPEEPVPLSAEALERFAEACSTEGLAEDQVLERAGLTGTTLTEEHLPALRAAFTALVEGKAPNSVSDENQGVVGVPENPVRPATRAQVGKVKGLYDTLGVIDRDDQLRATAIVIEREIDTHNDLTADEASKVIEHLVALEAAG